MIRILVPFSMGINILDRYLISFYRVDDVRCYTICSYIEGPDLSMALNELHPFDEMALDVQFSFE